MATAKKPSHSGKVADITAPGKSAPSATSRPIIVTNRPVMKRDPMVIGESAGQEDAKSSTETAKEKFKVPKKIKLEPLSPLVNDALQTDETPSAPAVPESAEEPNATPAEQSAEDDSEAIAVTIKTATPTTAPPLEETASATEQPGDSSADADPATATTRGKVIEPPAAADSEVTEPDAKPLPEKPEPAPEETTAAPDEEPDELGSSQAAPNKAIEDAKRKEAEAEAERIAEQEKIIESKQYFLPINMVERRRGVRRALLALGIVLILTLVWLDIVLDAGIVHLGDLRPLTDFFSS